MKKLQYDLELRTKVRAQYISLLKNVAEIIVPFAENQEFVSNYIIPIVLKNSTAEKRDKIRDQLHARGIQTSVHYPAIHRFSIYKEFNALLPITEYVSDNEITLPMYSSLSIDEVNYICSTLKEILTQNS
jgi:dTDP-4-amino-4,6-dideoxygalactose transaminase